MICDLEEKLLFNTESMLVLTSVRKPPLLLVKTQYGFQNHIRSGVVVYFAQEKPFGFTLSVVPLFFSSLQFNSIWLNYLMHKITHMDLFVKEVVLASKIESYVPS